VKKLWLLFLVLAPACPPVHSFTLGDIKTEVRRITDDRADPGIDYTDANIVSIINQVQRDVVNQTWCVNKSTTITLSVATTYYATPTDFINVYQVAFKNASGRWINLEEVSERAERQSNPDFERQPGSPTRYFLRQNSTGLEMGVLPVPSSSTTTGTIRADYYAIPTDLSANTDVPFNGLVHLLPYQEVLIYGTVAQLKLFEGDTAGATAYSTMYTNLLALMKSRLGMMPNYNPGFGGATK
jgi:hypothetical protein